MSRANSVLRDHIAAVSCGVYNNTPVLDLDYAEDSEADTNANFVMSGAGNIVEIQATAEKMPFQRGTVPGAVALAAKASRSWWAQKIAVTVGVRRQNSKVRAAPGGR